MRNWLIGKQKHLLIWAVLLIYVFTANTLYVQFFMKNGKPFAQNVSLPADTKGITYKLNDMQPMRVDEQNLYGIRGFAFETANPAQQNKISFILSSPTQNFAFPTRPMDIPNMIESYQGYNPSMNHAEFLFLVSNDGLKPGTYRIGILLESAGGTSRDYVLTGGTIKKTYNTIQYIPGP